MAISQYSFDAVTDAIAQLRIRNIWLIRIRWLVLIMLSLAILATGYSYGFNNLLKSLFIFGAGGVAAVNFVLSYAAHKEEKSLNYYKVIAFVQILLDLYYATFSVYYNRGLQTRAIIFYALPILAAGVLFRGLYAYVTSAISWLAYSGVLLWVVLHGNSKTPAADLLIPSLLYGSFFFILAAVADRTTARTLAQEREQSYSQVLAMLRHQMHHPSSVIAVATEMLEKSKNFSKWPNQDKEYLQMLKRENERLNTMISNLLQATQSPGKRSDEKIEAVDFYDLLSMTALSMALKHKRPNDLELRIPTEPLMLELQPEQMRIALENIINNAFQYSLAESQVTVSSEALHGKLFVKIEDHGKGISKDEQAVLFQLFSHTGSDLSAQETSAQLYSMGLGLYVAQGIIKNHGGEVKVNSVPGKGTTVTIELPDVHEPDH